MELIRELLEISAYRPESGYSLDLVELAQAGLSSPEAVQHWVSLGRSGASYYSAYKVLKDNLVRLAFVERKNVVGAESKRLEVWEKYKIVQQLLITQKKSAAIELAVDLVRMAMKCGCTEIVVGLTSVLESHFGGIEPDTRRYLRYRKLRKEYAGILEDELNVKALQAKLVFYLTRKKNLSELKDEIEVLDDKKKGSVTFMRYRFSVLSIWFELKSDLGRLMDAFRETVSFYENCGEELPRAALTNLYVRLTPNLISNGLYGEAGLHLVKALRTTLEGSQNWHVLMLQKACLGLVSQKKGMAISCFKQASLAPREHNNPEIDEKWELVQRLAAEGECAFERVWGAVF